MKQGKFKIGYSNIGGIFIGKNIQSDFHKNHLISILFTLGPPFEITIKRNTPKLFNAITIQKDINYKLSSSENDLLIFIHIDPYSENGLRLTQKNNAVQELSIELFDKVIEEIKDWFNSSDNTEEITEDILNKVTTIAENKNPEKRVVDDRIIRSMQLIKTKIDDKISIKEIAYSVNISPSHYARLFKKETGIAFRKYILHCRLVSSLKAMYKENSLTEASFIGGFSDQPHFTRTFKKSFGIKPSTTKK